MHATERLTLRRPTAADVDAVFAIYADPRTNVHDPDGPHLDVERSRATLARWIAHWDAHGHGMWVLAPHSRPEHVLGFGGLTRRDYGGVTRLNLGYRLAADAWGHGYATELGRAALRHARDTLRARAVYALVRPANEGSRRVLRKLGMRVVALLDDVPDAEPSLVHRLDLRAAAGAAAADDAPTSAVGALLADDPALRAVWAAAVRRMRGDAAHDPAHLWRVAEWTLRLLDDARGDVGDLAGVGDARAIERVAVAAALLHDVVNVPKESAERAEASTRSAEVARELLPTLGFAPIEVELAADAIRHHSYSYCTAHGIEPRSAVARALQDADRLEALGALGVLRCVAAGTAMGTALLDAVDPWATARALDDRRFALDRFQTKLLRLPPTLLTAGGRAEAARRASVMVALLRQLGTELDAPYVGLDPGARA